MKARSTSPFQHYQQQSQQQPKKYYSREEVSHILRTVFEAKLAGIYKQLQQKQQLIRVLNDKLNKNDALVQNSTKILYELADQCAKNSNINIENTIQLINKVLNQRLNGYWLDIQNHLNKIREDCQETIYKYHQKLHQKIGKMLNTIKKQCQDNVENFKKKNNAYWVKVKQVLGKVNSRTTVCQQKMAAIGIQINKYQIQRQQNSKNFKQIQNGPNTARMLVQLRKSVNNVYKNFQQVIKLQQIIRQNYQGTSSLDKWSSANPQQHNNKRNIKSGWNSKSSAHKQQDIVILQYSIEDDSMSNQHSNNNSQVKKQASSKQNSRLDVQQYTKSMNLIKKPNHQQFYPLSPITGRVFENSNISNTQVLLASDKNKNTHQTAITNTSMKNQTLQWAEHQFFNQGKNDSSNSFQLITTTGLTANINLNSNSRNLINSSNQVSTSMLNFSLECRKQMIESIRPRLLQMVETKGMPKPIKVYMDQINYLKNQEGNYLFDLKGNMFKLTTNQFMELERDQIIYNIKSAHNSRKNSRVLQ